MGGRDRKTLNWTRFVIDGIYIYNKIILQFFVFPTQNCVLHTGKPAQNIFSCNFFVSFFLFIPTLMVEIGQKIVNLRGVLDPGCGLRIGWL